MSNRAEAEARRRAILIVHMSSPIDIGLSQRHYTRVLRRAGFAADSNSTNADMRWFRKHGIELGYVDNPLQSQVDKIKQDWKDR